MSGILLPGQDRESKPEGKIELPKGFKAGKPEPRPEAGAPGARPAETPLAAGEAEKQADQSAKGPAPQPARRGQRGQPMEFLFPPRGAQVRCPSCGASYVVPVFTLIDLGANPELRSPLLGGQVNVAVCQSCGAGGPLSTPLMVHDPEHQFLGVFMPLDGRSAELQRQKAIGDLSQMLMRKIPAESRKGYMLQPRQFVDWDQLLEQLWGFEGVTPEMLRKQRDQSALLQRLLTVADDPSALDILLGRSADLIDREFFTLLDQLLLMSRGQAQDGALDQLRALRDKLLESTEAGRSVKRQQDKVRAVLDRVQKSTTREQVLDIVLEAWRDENGQQMVGTLAIATGIPTDYQFLMLVSQRIDAATDVEERAELMALRTFLLEIQEQVQAQKQQSQEEMAEQVQAVLQEVLQAKDTAAALREHADAIDEMFLALLAANIRAAEQNGASAAARRLTQVYQQALVIAQERLPADMRLLNQILMAPDDAAARQLLRENRELLNRDFVENMKGLEEEMRENGRADLADRMKSLRGQIALMI